MIIAFIAILIFVLSAGFFYFNFSKCKSSQIKGFDNNGKSVCLNKDDFCYNKDTGLKYGVVLNDSDSNKLKCFKNNDSCGFNKKIVNYACVYVDPVPQRSTKQSILIKSINKKSSSSNPRQKLEDDKIKFKKN